jgi:hypothetical protein
MTSPVRLSVRLVIVLAAAVSTGCGSTSSTPRVLMDGSHADATPVELERVARPVVMTRARSLDAGDASRDPVAASCLRGPAGDARPEGKIVERVGVSGESVTLRDSAGLHACDNSPGPREAQRRWCGSAFGRLEAGRLRDPRLDIAGCRTAEGAAIAFAWVVTRPRTRFLVVAQPDYSEVYEAEAGLPVRISSPSGARSDPVGATFDLSEHDDTGRLLRTYRLEAYPAG